MNLYIRFLLMYLLARWRGRISLFDEYRSRHIVWPNDLDLLGHVNNGRYFTITDVVRLEILIRAGVWQAMRRRGLYPVIAGETIQFRRALRPFQRYTIRTNMVGWDEKFLYIEHKFERRGTAYALALIKVRVIGTARPRPIDILREVDPTVPAVHMSEDIETWNASTENHWQSLAAAA